MKLYFDPVSTACRPILLFINEAQIDMELEIVSLMAGENRTPAYLNIHPLGTVPVLDDGALHLTQSSAILKYLADVVDSPLYPKDLKHRALVNARLDWISSDVIPAFAQQHIYPQILPQYRRASEEGHQSAIAWGLTQAQTHLNFLNDHVLSEGPWLCGDQLTIADYQAACVITVGEWVGFDLSPWPVVQQWIDRMSQLPAWAEVNAAFYGMREALRAA